MTGSPVDPWESVLDHVVAEAFDLALRLMAGTPTAVSLALGGLEPIELPPSSAATEDTEWLSVAGALYLAANLEAAGVVVAAETVASLVAAGGFTAPLDRPSADAAVGFWRGRRERLAEEERQEFFARIFGDLPGLSGSRARRGDDAVEMALIGLADAMVDSASLPGSATRVALCTAASTAGEALAGRAGGFPTVVAADLIDVARTSLGLLGRPGILAALGSRTVWGALQEALRRYRGERRAVATHVSVGRDGVQLLSWLHAAWPAAASGRCSDLPVVGDQTVVSATSWLQGSLSLHESQQHVTTAPRPAA